MREMHIGIIGGTRGMGNWFARFFESEGYGVHISGRTTGMNIKEMADRCNVVIVSVPIRDTVSVINTVGPLMGRDALLMDMTSLKREPVNAMAAASISEVVGCHPLFGPQVDTMEGQNIVLCPIRGERWLHWLKSIFSKRGANVIETTPENHDRMMAVVQGLNHLNTVVMGIALSRAGFILPELKSYATPAFRAKLKIIKTVFGQNPGLYAEIMTMNPDISSFVEMYASILVDLETVILRGDAGAMTALIEKHADYFKSEC